MGNELSWLDWERADDQLLAFCADIVAFRRRHPADLDTAASSTRPETRLAGTAVAVAAYSLQTLRRV